jgi:NAD(P)-dependent dehydrogenase (short-subunit alcohol dehydrogenase family)
MNRHDRQGAGQVLLDFQTVMDQFLTIQKDVLSTYLSRAGSSAALNGSRNANLRAAMAGLGAAESRSAAGSSVTMHTAPARPAVEPVWIPPAEAVALHDEPWSGPKVDATETVALARLTLRATARPTPSTGAKLARERAIVITDDGRGVAIALAALLESDGYPVALVRSTPGSTASGGDHVCSLQSLAEAEWLVQSVASTCRGIAAIVHLLPLDTTVQLQRHSAREDWERLWLETRTLFLLAKAAAAGLQTAASEGGAALIAVTPMGGAFASDPRYTPASFFPGHAGVVGLTKCLALEWPEVRVKAVDTDPGDAPDVIARQIFDELWARDAEVEIGYSQGVRLGLDLVQAPSIIESAVQLHSDSVVLATGGARGITAEVCLELAERYQPTLVLVGQTRLPDSAEPPAIAGLESPAELKRGLLTLLAKDRTPVTVPMVEKAYQQLLREREIRRNLGALSATGARVHYVTVDIRDDDAFAALIADVYATYGRLDGIVHGAGIIEDKLVQDKTTESFERVLETKTRSGFVLSRCLQMESLRFAVFFSSVAGRFGNRGQGDYAAANEVVNKLAVLLDRRSSVRVCSINWAPWDKRGMVSPALKREFKARGVELIDPVAGRRAFWEEIQQPRISRPEVVIAGSPRASLNPAAAPVVETLPLMKHASRQRGDADVVKYERLLDVSIDEYLRDHRLDGRAVLPLAFAMELMAEAAHATWPELTVLRVRNLQLLKGISLDDAPLRLEVTVRTTASVSDPAVVVAAVDIAVPAGSPALRYRGIVELAARAVTAPLFTPPLESLQPFPLSLAEAYRLWTFHGAAFQRITAMDGIGPTSMTGQVYSCSADSGIAAVRRADWSIDPFVFDCALQMLLMWSRAQNDKTALPSRLNTFARFGSLSDVPLRCYVAVESLAGGHALRSTVHFVGPDDRLLGVLEGMEASCTAALNRLAVQ